MLNIKKKKTNNLGQNLFFFSGLKILVVILIFAALAISNSFFLETKHTNEQKSVFECGFKSYKNVGLNLNFNFFFSTVLVVLYELEFLFFVPFMFNLDFVTFSSMLVFLWLSLTMLVTFFIDIKFSLTQWNF